MWSFRKFFLKKARESSRFVNCLHGKKNSWSTSICSSRLVTFCRLRMFFALNQLFHFFKYFSSRCTLWMDDAFQKTMRWREPATFPSQRSRVPLTSLSNTRDLPITHHKSFQKVRNRPNGKYNGSRVFVPHEHSRSKVLKMPKQSLLSM